MEKEQYELVVGALLHDIGKVIYRVGDDHRKHSESGFDFLKNEIKVESKSILDSVRYHHGAQLRGADVDDNSDAYIVYIADNIASSTDRREKEEVESGFEVQTLLQPVFNLLNGASYHRYYSASAINVEKSINYPTDKEEKFCEQDYRRIITNISDNLKGLNWSEGYVNSLLEVLESNLSFVPSSTSKKEVPDISLYDHVKLTAGIASCIKAYVDAEGITSLKDTLFTNGNAFYSVKAFRLASLDISGIQKFIYTISTDKALRTLRARSFYLEILMEHLVDELLSGLSLSRANLIYSGGGHCYLLIPNTKKAIEQFEKFLDTTNEWFLENFGAELYIAGASAPCSSDDMKNLPSGSYQKIYTDLQQSLSEQKNRRYSAKQIMFLNHKKVEDYTRECSVCRNIGAVDENGRCSVCAAIEEFSKSVLYDDFFTIERGDAKGRLPLPGGCYLISDNEKTLKERMEQDASYVRTYGKNKAYTGQHIATKLWVGNYTKGSTFEEFAKESEGFHRVGILRADVDNLGSAFIAGFKNPKNDDRYMTLSRTATLSRQLSLFFKLHINKILAKSEYSVNGEPSHERNVTIVYSGGDDLFLVGSWNEVIEAAVDIRRAFDRYTEGTLSLSAGIGLYSDSYPISASAKEVARQEDSSKNLPGKNAVTLLEDGMQHIIISEGKEKKISDGTYPWNEFETEVMGEKFDVLAKYFGYMKGQQGNSFLYHLLDLIRKQEDRINFARFVYLIARMEPDAKAEPEIKEAYREFSKYMTTWIQSEKDRRHLKTAIEYYVYLNRKYEEEGEE